MHGFRLPARSRLVPAPDLVDPVAEGSTLTPRDLFAAIPRGQEDVDVDLDDVAYDEVAMDALFGATAPEIVIHLDDARLALLIPDLVDPVGR